LEVLEITSKSSENTLQIAKTFAKYLSKGNTVVLTGELGSGKTKFVEGFLEFFGLQDEISSPTFNIVNEYYSNNINIYHFDVYRLEDIDEFYAFGGEEYFEKGICLIEWGEIIQEALPQNYIQIIFKKDNANENKRILEFKIFGNSQKYFNLLDKFKEELN
jgi:tRNA threonylcarbamoyladenosine biosynthesis protein TsaE